MMKHLITIAALLITSLCHGQGIWSKSATNTIINRGKDDSVRIIPRDTLPTNNALYNGSPVGNYARIAAKHGKFYFHDSVYNRRVAFYDDIDESIWYTPLTPLLSEPADPIQPTDSVIVAFGKLQAQLNEIIGKYILNQSAIYDVSRFKISGQSAIKSNTDQLSIVRDSDTDEHHAIIAFKDAAEQKIGYYGLGGGNAIPTLYDVNLISGKTNIVRDTASAIFGTFNGTSAAFYTTWRNGKFLLSDVSLSEANFSQDTAHYALELRTENPISATFNQAVKLRAAYTDTVVSQFQNQVHINRLNVAGQTKTDSLTLAGFFYNKSSTKQMNFFQNGDLEFVHRGAGDIKFYTNSASLVPVTILNGGNVGIGTETPSVALEVVGNTKITGSIEVGGVKWLTGSGSPETVVAAPVGSLFSDTGGNLYFKSGGGTGNTGWIIK